MPFLLPGQVSNVGNGLETQQELGQGEGGGGGKKDHLSLVMACEYTKVSVKESIPSRVISKLHIKHKCMHIIKCLRA